MPRAQPKHHPIRGFTKGPPSYNLRWVAPPILPPGLYQTMTIQQHTAADEGANTVDRPAKVQWRDHTTLAAVGAAEIRLRFHFYGAAITLSHVVNP